VALSLLIRFDLSSQGVDHAPLPDFVLSLPELQIMSGDSFSLAPLVTSSHALIMIVFMMGPALFGGFVNWLVPMMIGTHNMVFPRLNLLAFFLLPLGFLLLLGLVFFVPTLFMAVLLLILALHIVAISFILSAINFIATILAARAPFMRLRYMPSFVWSVLVASFLAVATLPVMSAALTLTLGRLAYGISLGLPLPASLPHLPIMMWFFTHPEFFILILPAFGLISEVIATFSGGRLVMEKVVKGAFVAIGSIGFVLWSQTIFSNGDAQHYQEYFPLVMLVFALPIGLILTSWLMTIGKYARLQPVPMLWAMGFISMLLVAALSSIGSGFPDSADGGSSVGHFHYIVGLSSVFAIFAGWYFWFGKISGYEIRISG